MSPLPPPPPAGTIIPSDDWTDDASFDFSDTSPSKATSSRIRHSISGLRSPLRQSFAHPPSTAKPVIADDEDDMDFDFDDIDNKDGTDSFPAISSRFPSGTTATPFKAKSQTGGLVTKGLSGTVMGSGPGGIGTITKLVSKPTALSKGSIKLKAKAVSKAWEDDMDFDDLGEDDDDDGDWKAKLAKGHGVPSGQVGTIKKIQTVSSDVMRGLPLRTKVMPDADALDDLEFDLEGGEEEDNEATLKASATLKARLPPPKPRTTHATPPPPPADNDDNLDNDDDFDLPLNLTNLNLASRASSSHDQPKHPRTSGISTDWDSPGASTSTSASGGKKQAGWWSESPSKRFSETSSTSISDGVTPLKGKGRQPESGGPSLLVSGSTLEEDDMEDGLVLPTKTFFVTTSKRELDSMLDRKRKPQFAPYQHPGDVTARPGSGNGGFEEGMEDGLVFEDHGKELTMNRLTMGKKARSQIPVAMKKTATRLVPKDRHRDTVTPQGHVNGHGQGLGSIRHPSHDLLGRTPALNALRERAQSTAGHRSHSTGNVGSMKPFSPTRPESSPPIHGSPSKNTEQYRSRSGQPLTSILPPMTPSRGLRHQKSHQVLSSPSPAKASGSTLTKKQSLSSLHDIYTASTVGGSALQTLAEDTTITADMTGRYHNSTSRLTMPTSSSKAKRRPPISAVFPMANTTSTHASSSTATPQARGHSQSPPLVAPLSTRSKIRQGHMGVQMRRRDWGDGTELEGIDDLEVEVDEKEKKSSWSRSTKSKRKPMPDSSAYREFPCFISREASL